MSKGKRTQYTLEFKIEAVRLDAKNRGKVRARLYKRNCGKRQ